jgi:phage gp36-like protein
MAYLSDDDFIGRFGADEFGDLTEGNDFAAAADDATNLIDGYLASRYALPLVSVPTIVKAWAADIARFRLWDERAPEEVRRRYEDAMAQLRDLAAGRLALPPGSDGARAAGGFEFEAYANERVFTADTLKGF